MMWDSMGELNFYAYCCAWALTCSNYAKMYGRNAEREAIAFRNAERLGIVFW